MIRSQVAARSLLGKPPAFEACAVDLVLKIEDLIGDIRDLRTDYSFEGIGDIQLHCENGKGIRE